MKVYFFLFTFFSVMIVNAQKIAYIEQTVLLKSLKNYEKNTKIIDSTKNVYSQEIKESNKKLNDKFNVLLKNYNITENDTQESVKSKLSEIDRSKFELYQDESKLIEKTSKNYELALNELYKEKVQPLLDKLNKSIENYAKNNKIDVVYILENLQPALAYIDTSKNITAEIKKLL